MKRILHFLLLGGLFLPALLNAQISNIQVSAEGNDIVINYDYASQDESIDEIIVTYTSGNDTVPKEAKQISGDIRDIRPGTGKRIVWSPLNEMTSFSADNLVINLSGLRDFSKQSQCDNSLKLADRFFSDKDYENAIRYYQEMLDCSICNCNPKDILYASEQVKLSNKKKAYESSKDSYNIAYLFDMATAEGGGSMHGISTFLLRNKGVGYYASFRSNKHYYSPQSNISYYTKEEEAADKYDLQPLADARISSWLFSTGITAKVARYEFLSAHIYGGVGLGANSIAQEYSVTEAGYNEKNWITDGNQNLFFSPEVGVIANVYDYVSVMAGIKYPLSLTSNDAIEMKGLSFMLGVGLKLKSIDPNGSRRNNTYVAYTFDLPTKAGPDKLKSANIIGISTGTISYNKLGAYFSARINPLLFNSNEEVEIDENARYTGVSDYGNAFGTIGLTWMYFYGGVGVSYQKEYKEYSTGWTSPSSKVGAYTEFGVNLRLFDRLLLRGGITMPDFSISSKDNVFSIGTGKIYYSLGIGYVLPSAY